MLKSVKKYNNLIQKFNIHFNLLKVGRVHLHDKLLLTNYSAPVFMSFRQAEKANLW